MADNDITIERSLEQIRLGIKVIGDASREIDKDLKAVNAGLRFDPSNTELLAQKQELLAQKLQNSKDRSQELAAAISELNRIKAENGQLTDGQAKLLATYEQQLKNTSIEVTALTGATQKQADTNKAAEDSTKSFSKSMTEFQSNLSAVKQVMSGVDNAFKLFGGDSNSTMGLMIKQGQQAVGMMSGIASMGKLLGQSNNVLAQTFGNVAFMAGTAVGVFQLASSVIKAFGKESKVVAGVITGVGIAASVAAIGVAIFKGTLSRGLGALAVAGGAAAAAGITALVKGAKAGVSEDAADMSSVASVPTVSTPSVPTQSSAGGGGNASSVVVNIDYQRIENAVIRAMMSSGNISSLREAIFGGENLTSAITTGTARGVGQTMNAQNLARSINQENRRTGKV